jgi:hypothetical protein
MFLKHVKMSTFVGPTTIFGSGGTGPEKPDRTRFYACELKWNTWSCKPTKQKTWMPANDSIATQLVPISYWIPEFLDAAVVSFKLQKPVFVRKD